MYIFKLAGFGETRIGQSSTMQKVKARLRKTGLSWDNVDQREEYQEIYKYTKGKSEYAQNESEACRIN